MASIVQQPALESEHIVEMLLSALVLTALAAVLAALLHGGWAAVCRRNRQRRSSLAAGEHTFVGRLGRAGPELFVVGAGVRRLTLQHGQEAAAWWREAGQLQAVLATTMLAETLGRRPSRDLAWSFVKERLAGLSGDGFVLEAAEVFGWLDAHHGRTSERGSRAREAASACAAWVALRLKSAGQPAAEARARAARKAR